MTSNSLDHQSSLLLKNYEESDYSSNASDDENENVLTFKDHSNLQVFDFDLKQQNIENVTVNESSGVHIGHSINCEVLNVNETNPGWKN